LQKLETVKKEDLQEILSSWENLGFVIHEIANHPELYSELMEIALYNPEQKSWRAAYLIDKINDEFSELLFPYLEKIIKQLETENNSSKKRHFLKMISMNKIHEKHFGFLLDYCLNTMGNNNEPPAVRVHAMQILFNISEKETGLKPEILACIEHEMEFHTTAGISSRGSKLAQKLQKQIYESKKTP
jgi:hypothetical protein